MTRHRLTTLWQLTAIAASLLSTACTSTSRLGAARLAPGQPPTGLPFTLTKPMFVVAETRSTLENPHPSYSLAVAFVPDPDQRFTLSQSPATFSERDFKVILGELGEINELNAASRDKLAPTLKAIGSFMTKGVGALATGGATSALFDEAAKQPKFFANIEKYVGNEECSPSGECKARQTKAQCAELGASFAKLKERWERNPQVDLLFALDEKEERLLDVTIEAIACDKKEYSQDVGALVQKYKASNGALVVLDDFSKVASKSDLLSANAALEKSSLPDDQKLELKSLSFSAQSKVVGNIEAAEELALIKQGWRHAYASFLERSIDHLDRQEAIALRAAANSAAAGTEAQAKLASIRSESSSLRLAWARVIEAQQEYLRAEILRGVLAAIAEREKGADPANKAESFSDYAVAQKELSSLEATIAAKRAALVPAKKDAPRTPPATRTIIPTVLWALKDNSDGDWVRKCLSGEADSTCRAVPWSEQNTGNPLPEFVVVVEKGAHP